MSTGPILRAAVGGLVRRPVQSVVVFLVLMAATAAATLGLTLYTSANEAFLHAFTAYRAPDLAVTVDATRVTRAELGKTTKLPEVTKAAGPYPETTLTLASGPGTQQGPSTSPPLTVVGRVSRGGPLDALTQNGGLWPAGRGEIALGIYVPFRLPLGSKVTAVNVPGHPQLTVVGYGGSEPRDEDAWTTPSEITALERAGAPRQEEMLYSFKSAAAGTSGPVRST